MPTKYQIATDTRRRCERRHFGSILRDHYKAKAYDEPVQGAPTVVPERLPEKTAAVDRVSRRVVGRRFGEWCIVKRIGSVRGAHKYLGLLWVCRHDDGQVRVFDSAGLHALDPDQELPFEPAKPRRLFEVKSISQ